jgi:hypothetical protein
MQRVAHFSGTSRTFRLPPPAVFIVLLPLQSVTRPFCSAGNQPPYQKSFVQVPHLQHLCFATSAMVVRVLQLRLVAASIVFLVGIGIQSG